MRLATSTTVCAPSWLISCAYTVFTDEIVACLQRQAPVAARLGVRDVPHRRRCPSGISIEDGAANTVLGEMPFSSAATSANGLNDEPAWRPRAPARRQVHAAVAGGGVPVVGVLAADHRAHVSVPRIDHGHRAGWIARIREHRADRALCGAAAGGIDRGRDAQSAGEQQLVAILARLTERRVRQEPLLEVVDEVRERVALPRREGVELDRLGDGLVPLGARDHRLLQHLPQDVVPPHPRVDRVGERIEVVRRADQARPAVRTATASGPWRRSPKYERAAAWMPYAPWPKYTVFRYFVRICSLVS